MTDWKKKADEYWNYNLGIASIKKAYTDGVKEALDTVEKIVERNCPNGLHGTACRGRCAVSRIQFVKEI